MLARRRYGLVLGAGLVGLLAIEMTGPLPVGGREWRMPPLWAIGLVETVDGHTDFLHDGRARNLAEAIRWHGGDADADRAAFMAMQRADREALLAFLASL